MSDVAVGSTFQPQNNPDSTPNGHKWDAIAIIEELSHFDKSLCEGSDPQLVDTRGHFGPNFFVKEVRHGAETPRTVKNFFVSEIEKTARYAMPFVRNLRLLLK